MELLPDGRCLIRLEGDVDLAVVPDLVAEFEYALDQLSCDLLVEVTGVDFVDSSGLAALVRARQNATARGGSLVLTGSSAAIDSLLVLTRLEELFDVVRVPADGSGANAGS